MSIHRQRLGLYIPWGLFFLACIGWTVFWFAAKDAAIKRLDAAIVQAKARGIEVGYAQVRASGYPLHLKLTLTDAHVQMAPLPKFAFVSLPVSVNLVDPSHLIIDLKDGVRWTGRDGAVHVINPVRGAMSVHWKDRTLTRVSLDLEGAPTRKMLAHLRPDPRAEDSWQIAIDVDGQQAADRLRLGVVVDQASQILAAPAGDPLGAWVVAEGTARIETGELLWNGGRAEINGRLRLDAERRPLGSVTLNSMQGSELSNILRAMLRQPPLTETCPAPSARDDVQGCLRETKLTVVASRGQWRIDELSFPARPLYVVSSPP